MEKVDYNKIGSLRKYILKEIKVRENIITKIKHCLSYFVGIIKSPESWNNITIIIIFLYIISYS
jgi:hypothetical protein